VPRLPVAGIDVNLRLPSGADDLILLESGDLDVEVAVGFLSGLVTAADGSDVDWPALALADVDAALLRLRQRVLGDVVRAEVVCTGPGCGERVDVEFSIDRYLEHHRPRTRANVTPTADGWFRLDASDVEFRLPTVADQQAIVGEPQPERALASRCVRPAELAARTRRRADAAMAAMAPNLASTLEGVCPECGAAVTAYFDPLYYVLRELRDQAAFLYEDVCAIAQLTHWSETEILALPAVRRARYAELARLEAATA
jgi:hypothetical protein